MSRRIATLEQALLVDAADGVMTLTLNRPAKRTAIDGEILEGPDAASPVGRLQFMWNMGEVAVAIQQMRIPPSA